MRWSIGRGHVSIEEEVVRRSESERIACERRGFGFGWVLVRFLGMKFVVTGPRMSHGRITTTTTCTSTAPATTR